MQFTVKGHEFVAGRAAAYEHAAALCIVAGREVGVRYNEVAGLPVNQVVVHAAGDIKHHGIQRASADSDFRSGVYPDLVGDLLASFHRVQTLDGAIFQSNAAVYMHFAVYIQGNILHGEAAFIGAGVDLGNLVFRGGSFFQTVVDLSRRHSLVDDKFLGNGYRSFVQRLCRRIGGKPVGICRRCVGGLFGSIRQRGGSRLCLTGRQIIAGGHFRIVFCRCFGSGNGCGCGSGCGRGIGGGSRGLGGLRVASIRGGGRLFLIGGQGTGDGRFSAVIGRLFGAVGSCRCGSGFRCFFGDDGGFRDRRLGPDR